MGRASDDAVLVKLTPAGHPDPRFGVNGIVISDEVGFEGLTDRQHSGALVLQRDGKIVIGGRKEGHSVLARFNPDGSVDQAFGTGGVVRVDYEETGSGFTRLVSQTSGRMIGFGPSGSVLTAFTKDGVIDTTFATRGRLQFESFEGGTGGDFSVLSVQPDDRLLLAGGDLGHRPARLTADGTLDQRFGNGGVAKPGPCLCGLARAVGAQPDGKVLVAGEGPSVIRYLQDGSVDESFGHLGRGPVKQGESSTDTGSTVALHVQTNGGPLPS